MTVGNWPGRDEIARRAKRRTWIPAVFAGVVAAVVVPITESRHHHRDTHQHHSVAAATLLISVSLLILIAAGLGVRYLVRHRSSAFATPIIAGLPWRQRRAVGRNVRKGTPSDDPVMANVERETAQRIVTMGRHNQLVLTFVVLAAVLQVFIQHGTSRILFAAGAIFIGATAVRFRLSLLPKAHRYLEAADGTTPPPS